MCSSRCRARSRARARPAGAPGPSAACRGLSPGAELRPRSAARRGRRRGSSATRGRLRASPRRRFRAGLERASVGGAEGEADPVLAGVDPQEGDFSEVDGEDAVLGADVVPTALLELPAEVLQRIVAEPDRDDLAPLEPDLDSLRLAHHTPR